MTRSYRPPAKCAIYSCQRNATPGYGVCGDCLDRLLYGHVRPSAVPRVPSLPASPPSAEPAPN